MLPLVSFGVDTNGFVANHSKAEVALATVYAVFSAVCALIGPQWFDAANLFKFYRFTFVFSFTWKFYLAGWFFFIMYFVVLTSTRRLWDRHEQRLSRVVPVSVAAN